MGERPMNIARAQPATLAAEHHLVEAVRAMVPKLRAGQAESDQLARVPEAIADEFQAMGVYSMMLPKALGGLQTSISTYMDVVTEIGRGNGGAAWAVTLVSACNWMAAGLYPKSVVDEVFAKPGTRCAGVFSGRKLIARPAKGGIFIEKGTWFFNSGVYQAHWDMLGVPMFDESGKETGPGIAMVPMSDVKILNDWDPSGLRASGSSNVSMENVFIPNERIVSLIASVEGRQPSAFPNASLYRSAFTPLMVIILAFPVLGLGMHMLEHFMERLPTRDIKLTPYTKQGEAAVTHLLVGKASANIDIAKMLIKNACREIDEWAASEHYMPRDIRARICRDSAVSNKLIWEAVDMLGTAAGGTFARNDNTLNRIWQDTKVAIMHPYISLESHFELYGRMLCGVEPPLMPM
jgi:3-hydroxy-9,10-secoandrosta-1,3,5(10)-triene-9,17-dione monooxygenase